MLGKHSATELTTLLVLGKRTYIQMENRKEGPTAFPVYRITHFASIAHKRL